MSDSKSRLHAGRSTVTMAGNRLRRYACAKELGHLPLETQALIGSPPGILPDDMSIFSNRVKLTGVI